MYGLSYGMSLLRAVFRIRIRMDRINLSCWIRTRIRIQSANPDLDAGSFFNICKNVLLDIFSHEKKITICNSPQGTVTGKREREKIT
jgi:hypothetical protein